MRNLLLLIGLIFVSQQAFSKTCHFAFSCMDNGKEVYHTSSARGAKLTEQHCVRDKKSLCSDSSSERLSGCVIAKLTIIDDCAILVCNTLGEYRLGNQFYGGLQIKAALKKRMRQMKMSGACKL